MKKVYIDPDTFMCHTSQNNDGTRIPYETKVLDGKCDEYIESCRCVPTGYNWTRSDGEVFEGEMVTLLKPLEDVDEAQREYERKLLAEYEAALAESIPVSDLTAAYQEGVNSV